MTNDVGPRRYQPADAQRWNARYQDEVAPSVVSPPEIVRTLVTDLTPPTQALDVACGWGDVGLWLASRGATVTFIDISTEALATVEVRANRAGYTTETIAADLTTTSIPVGPWDIITCVHYLDRALLPQLGRCVAPEGQLLVSIATVTNRELHERPSAKYLLERNELPALVPELNITHFSEAWRSNGAHEAWLVATPRP